MELPGLNLRNSILNQWWESKNPKTAQMLEWMKQMESWNLDEHKGFSEALFDLTKLMESSSRDQLLRHSQNLIRVMAYMSPARAFRILEWGDSQFNKTGGFSLTILEAAVSDTQKPENLLLIDRLRVLQGVILLGTVFSANRVSLIKKLLKKELSKLDE